MQLKKISEVIEKEIKENDRLKEAILRLNWKKIVEKEGINAEINYYKNKVIYVLVGSSAAKHHMYINKNKIIKEIFHNTNFIIDDIQISIK